MINECKAILGELTEMRRSLHKIPELGTELPETKAYVCAKLDEYGVEYTFSSRDSAVLAVIKGFGPGKTLALRADMDALPIKEETGLPFASDSGRMHACGHDAHTAMLLGTAKVLQENRDKFKGEVRLIFQTAEERSKGADIVIAEGWLKGVDAVFGTHIGTIAGKEFPAGTVIACPGPIMASFDRFIIKVKGSGCHGSTPEKGIDPVNIAAHIVLGLEAIGTREIGACTPNVVTIGRICGGTQYNVIPDEVEIEGTTRSFDANVRKMIAERIEKISVSTAEAFGGSAEVIMDWGAPPVVNYPEMAALAAEAAAEAVGTENVVTSLPHPNMGGEDFACFLQETPGAFLFLSSSNPAKHADVVHHNPKFDIDEDVLWIGPAVFTGIAEKFLK